jgi:hypothetical protein
LTRDIKRRIRGLVGGKSKISLDKAEIIYIIKSAIILFFEN